MTCDGGLKPTLRVAAGREVAGAVSLLPGEGRNEADTGASAVGGAFRPNGISAEIDVAMNVGHSSNIQRH